MEKNMTSAQIWRLLRNPNQLNKWITASMDAASAARTDEDIPWTVTYNGVTREWDEREGRMAYVSGVEDAS